MLRPRLAVIVAITLLATGAGSVSALQVPAAAPVHGYCTFNAIDVFVSGGGITAVGSGPCLANGVTTTGTLRINGRTGTEACPIRTASGAVSLDLQAFGQISGTASVVTSGGSASVVLAGGLSGAGTFAETPTGRCASQVRWNGALAF